jgi:hypothetical protein
VTETPALTDPELYPDDGVLRSRLGAAKPAYDAWMDRVRAAAPGIVADWNYYRDGKSWLLKAHDGKKKTVFWLSAYDGFFRVAFYFGAADEAKVAGADLPEDFKRQYAEAAGKRIRGITAAIRSEDDIPAALALLSFKNNGR